MIRLSFLVAAFACVSGVAAFHSADTSLWLLTAVAILCAATTWLAQTISTFLKIFIAIFGSELIIFGTMFVIAQTGYWPEHLREYLLPDSLPLTVAMFSITVWAVSHIPVVKRITAIADLYFKSSTMTSVRVWPLPAMTVMESRMAKLMIVCLVAINQAQVGMTVRLSYFNRDWFNAIQNKDEAAFWRLLFTVFLFWVVIYIASMIVEYIMQSMLVIRWRAWLAEHYISKWLHGATHYKMTLRVGYADNPDQRIAEDVTRFIDGGSNGIYSYSILLISTLSSLVSFALILWDLSSDFTIPGTSIAVPGFLFWAALIYAAIGTFITHVIGRSLVTLLFNQQRYEADFRFSLARLREYSEQVALLGGEGTEQRSTMQKFGAIFANYLRIVDLRKKLMAFTASYGQISPFIPYIVAAPFYFAGKIQLGVLSQTAGAFGRVEGALNFFISYYTSLADFKAVLDRLSTFDDAIAGASTPSQVQMRASASAQQLELRDVTLALPDGRAIMAGVNVILPAQKPVLLTGPSGSGKSTLFRAIAGIWSYGGGEVHVPDQAKIMLLPQKPYVPIGTLRAALSYPAAPDSYSDAQLNHVLHMVRLDDYADHLDESDNWTQRLSGGEQQKLSLARAVLARPDWLFMDEATSALDEASEAALYEMIARELPQTTFVSIGHRATLNAFHASRYHVIDRGDGSFTLAPHSA
jgi:vitamin B12/bleomycin/antimicrobial peptide transport system ATP-binding/permease protein